MITTITKQRIYLGLVALSALVTSGCASQSHQQSHMSASTYDSFTIPVVRVGRYKLMTQDSHSVELRQLPVSIDVSNASDVSDVTVARLETAISAAMGGTGYSLCSTPDVDQLISLNLPNVHQKLGPLPLDTMLQTLVGNQWQVIFNDTYRTVCFTPLSKDSVAKVARQ